MFLIALKKHRVPPGLEGRQTRMQPRAKKALRCSLLYWHLPIGQLRPAVMLARTLLLAVVLSLCVNPLFSYAETPIQPDKVIVPNVIGADKDKALGLLSDARLYVGTVHEDAGLPPSEEEAGFVFSQNPPAGTTVGSGSKVDIYLYGEYKAGKVIVPNVIGSDIEGARHILKSKGLSVATSSDPTKPPDDPQDEGTVYAQSPEAGTEVDIGDGCTVNYYGKVEKGEVGPFVGRWKGTIRSRRVKGRHPPEWFAKGGREITEDLPVGEWEEARPFEFRVVREGGQTIRVFFGSADKGDVFVLKDNVARYQSRNKNFTQDSSPGVISIVQRDWDWTLTRTEDEIHGKVYCTTKFSDGLSEREEFEIKAKYTE